MRNYDGTVEFEFTCPECKQSLTVNGSMKTVLIDRGCLLCGGAVTTDAFSTTVHGR